MQIFRVSEKLETRKTSRHLNRKEGRTDLLLAVISLPESIASSLEARLLECYCPTLPLFYLLRLLPVNSEFMVIV